MLQAQAGPHACLGAQELVDDVDQMRRKHMASAHKALVMRLLFILTRCSRLLLSGECQTPIMLRPCDASLPTW